MEAGGFVKVTDRDAYVIERDDSTGLGMAGCDRSGCYDANNETGNDISHTAVSLSPDQGHGRRPVHHHDDRRLH